MLIGGGLDTVEWNGGLECWNGMVDWNAGMEWWNGTVEWNGGILYQTFPTGFLVLFTSACY